MSMSSIQARDRSGGLLRELPVGIVDLNLRDGHRLRPAGPHQEPDSVRAEDRPLESQVSRPAARRGESWSSALSRRSIGLTISEQPQGVENHEKG